MASYKFSEDKKANKIIKLLKFETYSPFKKIVLFYLISILDKEATDNLRRAFETLDQNSDGIIDLQEIKKAINDF